ncbi:MAG TPA: hypothetical protein P5572_19030 [Phycisphaerae bacterium]|nr:hypothetical protein [Phycisphaerales bacterium]HRX87125.1 hypothetical protein [Phycisphaerae bacterium]
MIDGKDIVIRTGAGAQSFDLLLRVVRRRWPAMVVEDAVSGKVFRDYTELPFSAIEEILIYRDQPAVVKWQRLGACDELRGTMIHALVSGNELTVVVDGDPPAEVVDLVDSIRHAVRGDIFNIVISLRDAA